MKNTALIAVAMLMYGYTASAQHASSAAMQKSVLNLRGVISITYNYSKTTTSTNNTNTTPQNSNNGIGKRNTSPTGTFNYTKTTTLNTNTSPQQSTKGGINKKNTAPNGKSNIKIAITNTPTRNSIDNDINKSRNGLIITTPTIGYVDIPLHQIHNNGKAGTSNTSKYTIQHNDGKNFKLLKVSGTSPTNDIFFDNNQLRINTNINYLISVHVHRINTPSIKSPFSFLTETVYTASQY